MRQLIAPNPSAARDLWRQHVDRLPVERVKEALGIFEGSAVHEIVIADEADRVEIVRRKW